MYVITLQAETYRIEINTLLWKLQHVHKLLQDGSKFVKTYWEICVVPPQFISIRKHVKKPICIAVELQS